MTEHRSKNTLDRAVPVKAKTDVEEDGTSEYGSPRPVCNMNIFQPLEFLDRGSQTQLQVGENYCFNVALG